MMRLRLYDVITSRMPSLVGLCQSDVPQIANMVNSAQRRLLYAKEARDEGWYGTWAEIVFLVSRDQPYITLPREIARLEALNVCDVPVRVQNQWYEYLAFGNGRMPKSWPWLGNQGLITQALSRNNAVTFLEMTSPPQFITAYVTDAQDANNIKRTLIQGLDANSNPVYSENVDGNTITGAFMTFSSPFVTSAMTFTSLTGIQKDVTIGQVRYYQHDPTTGNEILILTMEPGETTAQYRRYYLHRLPFSCCAPAGSGCTGNPQEIQVTALAKLELVPCVVPTDWLLIQNLEAIIEECQSVRYSEMDSLSAKQMAAERHKQAIGMLLGEQAHYLGLNLPAVRFSPFGDARMTRQKIGRLI
jgi:hypothetical protein